jgi:hypothetical protein
LYGIGGFGNAGLEFFLFQELLDLFVGQQMRTGILNLRQKRPLLQMKNEMDAVFLVRENRGKNVGGRLLDLDRIKPAEARERADIFFDFFGVERITCTRSNVRGDCFGRDAPQTSKLDVCDERRVLCFE